MTPRVKAAATVGVLVGLAVAYALSVAALVWFIGWWTLPFTIGWGAFCIAWFVDALTERIRSE